MAPTDEQPPRARIVSAALDLMRSRGFDAASMRDIIEAAQAPRGSLQHYFPGGKEQLAIEAIELGSAAVGAVIDEAFARHRTAETAMRWFFDGSATRLVDTDYGFGCPVATIALERASLGAGDPVGDACRAALDDWLQRLATGFAGYGADARRAKRLASVVLAQYEGALLLGRVRRTPEPMRMAGAAVQQLLAAD